MKLPFRFIILMAFAVFVSLFSGCDHKELCFDHSHVSRINVLFDWSASPEASPESMSLYLFPQNGGKPLRYEFSGAEGGTIKVPNGVYDAICLNSDTEGIRYRHTEKFSTFEITTADTGTTAFLSGRKGIAQTTARARQTRERMAVEPDMLWCGRLRDIRVDDMTAPATVILYPEKSVRTYTVEIRNADNLRHVSQISGSISAMAGGILAGQGSLVLTRELVTIPFLMNINQDLGLVTGRTKSFGHCPSAINNHILTVYALMDDGSKWYYTIDITPHLHQDPGSGKDETHVILDRLPIPDPGSEGGGFITDVDGWHQIDEDLKM